MFLFVKKINGVRTVNFHPTLKLIIIFFLRIGARSPRPTHAVKSLTPSITMPT